MFEFSSKPIDTEHLRAELSNDEAGGFVVFEGWVRNVNDGKEVTRLEYEAYESLAVKEANKVIEEVRRLYPIIAVSCVHRLGMLAIGDVAVWVGVLSRHRGEAFDACRYVIDQIKARVPIWKKEFYSDGSSIWVNCAECASHAPHARLHHE